MSNKKILWICLAILIAGIAITTLIFSTEPEAKTEGASIETAMLVDVITVKVGSYEPTISATGTVQPVEDITLSPLVSGQIINRDPAFTPGGFVKKNQPLLQIDPSDYRNTLELRKSELLQSKTTLDTEMGRQQIAEQDLMLITNDSLFKDNPLSADERQLILRQPQLNAVKATIVGAKASVDQAQLNLERTTIRAPFDAHILSQNVTAGSQVGPGDDLGRLVGTEYYWVTATVPVSKLQWLHFPENDKDRGSEVLIKNSTAWPEEQYREGYLDKEIGALDGQTRLARVLVKVADPLAKNTDLEGKPKLMIGTFVEVDIQANKLDNVVRLSRDYIRSNETVWVMKEGKLEIREVDIVLTDNDYAYIRKGLEEGEQIVITDLSTVSNGIGLRTRSEGSEKEPTQ
ncbi:efflux RND transporter periplasmic adaptor subunit [Arenibacter algicola]|jgi:RND family efflux transporter MFP subunit|uniref:Multidrug resistance protein MdtA n=1 Tax=Arenibacter algicola TaxID=616991 RepID=A0A221UXV0_9FLAO|nr:efflux RND transporter periplasmic adaptor subunit [Arenibacter algicola]ASO05998.1 multidrug resistance protein MdtA [Arenibacter algicola]HCO85656.1 efflux RND transporter periplasmic adaptor subunit [Arenibacter sp.]|tara:strand:+ start:1036 stop:2244 length:1209 start_codon:yes stop_codon:yes gene_type:complete